MKRLWITLLVLSSFNSLAQELKCAGEVIDPGNRQFQTLHIEMPSVMNSPEQSFSGGYLKLKHDEVETTLVLQAWHLHAPVGPLQLKISSRQTGHPTFRTSAVMEVPKESDLVQLSMEIPGTELVVLLNCRP
jgi:hypothetical protein